MALMKRSSNRPRPDAAALRTPPVARIRGNRPGIGWGLVLLLFACAAVPAAAKRTTVQQLESLVASVHGRPDAEVADKLVELELTERLSSARMASLDSAMPGPMARGALMALADSSAFLRPPADEIADSAPPDPATQRQLLELTADYASQTLAKMPNFFATRETTLFMDKPAGPGVIATAVAQSLEFVRKVNVTVLYRDGKQVEQTPDKQGIESQPMETGLVTSGEFGPILGTLLSDAREGTLTWGYWERRSGTNLAVFRYSVPKSKSHYEAKFCCVLINSGLIIYQRITGYHGEIVVDTETGTILRLTMQADHKPSYPMARADLMVEYGLVEIGGKTYNCPVKSVAITRGYEPVPATVLGLPTDIGSLGANQDSTDRPEILQTMLNHVVFRQYHLFRSESRILTDEEAAPASGPPAVAPPTSPNR